MNLDKSYDYFKPESVTSRIHIVGCGAVGSTVAENLVRMGLTKITLWDFDTVDAHNIANQMYRESDIGKLKVEALADQLLAINPLLERDLRLEREGWTGQNLQGYIILAVDNIDLRRQIVEQHKMSPYVKAVFDYRIRLTDAQHYAADWADPRQVDALLRSMDFSHDEAKDATPRSACNIELSVVTTIRSIVSLGVQNMIEFIRSGGEHIKKLMLIDLNTFAVQAF